MPGACLPGGAAAREVGRPQGARVSLSQSLGELGVYSPSVVQVLRSAVRDSDPWVASAGLLACADVPLGVARELEADLAATLATRRVPLGERALLTLSSWPLESRSSLLPLVLKCLEDPDEHIQLSALEVTARAAHPPSKAMPILRALSQSGNAEVSAAAAVCILAQLPKDDTARAVLARGIEKLSAGSPRLFEMLRRTSSMEPTFGPMLLELSKRTSEPRVRERVLLCYRGNSVAVTLRSGEIAAFLRDSSSDVQQLSSRVAINCWRESDGRDSGRVS